MKRQINRQNRKRVFLIKIALLSILGIVIIGIALIKGPWLVSRVVVEVHTLYAKHVTSPISSMMKLEKVEWEEVGTSNLSYLVSASLLRQTTGLKAGQELLEMDLAELEKKILSIPWIETVQIQKQLPSTLAIRYSVYNARALGLRKGRAWLISSNGKWMAPVGKSAAESAKVASLDLPVLIQEQTIEAELSWLEALEEQTGGLIGLVHEVSFAEDSGKMNAVVELKQSSANSGPGGKISIVGLGKPQPESLIRLKRVVQYLIKNNILVSTIDIRPGKKVVVNVGK